MSRTWEEVKKELFTPEEIEEANFKAKFLDTVLSAYDENMGISRERLVEITVEFLENLEIKEKIQRKENSKLVAS
ncbi:MAG: hypothetical protein J6O04_06905 [Selenomonadaceae bacterium]|nr:hypothetical protein [Selenomonadaceae bacterium]